MKVSAFAIEQFGRWVVGGVPFAAAKNVVAALEGSDLSGEEKRQAAITQLRTFGYQLAGFLLNLAVELAVAWLKSKRK